MPSYVSQVFGSIVGESRVRALETVARALMGEDPAHGWPHVERVLELASRIVVEEGLEKSSVDLLALYLSILLHDIGRFASKGRRHAVESARIARELVMIAWSNEDLAKAVEHAILSHSYSMGIAPETLEAKILSDADKLDALGAIGIARVFHTGRSLGRSFADSIEHFKEKILKLPDMMHFEWSRREAKRRARRVELFLSWWLEESGASSDS